MSYKSGDPIKAPYTIYSVALCYFHRERNGQTVVAAHQIAVNGDQPLTDDEVKARAEKAVRADWDRRMGGKVKSEDYDLALWSAVSSVIK